MQGIRRPIASQIAANGTGLLRLLSRPSSGLPTSRAAEKLLFLAKLTEDVPPGLKPALILLALCVG
jgi:hypothetical protein